MNDTRNARGSVWHRWDPHLHGPGTLRNNQFGQADPWEGYLQAIEKSDPPIRALGVTDYYTLSVYEEIAKRKAAGRLPKVDLIFPNIEMRFGIGTGANSPINFHLLVSPDDPNHVAEIKRFLKALTFEAHHDTFRCEHSDLVRLGRAHNASLIDDGALSEGANQFKVSLDQLRAELKRNIWAQENILIAVASGTGDGTAGLQNDASLTTLRREIERIAHIIFDSNSKARKFWLGQGVLDLEELEVSYGGPKPCLHGCDAHSSEAIITAAPERNCWIKGDLCFETLRQVCIEPDARVSIGPRAPLGAMPSQVITSVKVTEAPWLKTPGIPLNAGLIAIIGARGSGKTALADIIAAGASALSANISERSFVKRASEYLTDSNAELTWEDGESTSQALTDLDADDFFSISRVRYLSQQFVDNLCLAEGLTDELLGEIERVIYQAHPPDTRMGTTSFRELLDLRAERGRLKRERSEEALIAAGRELNVERERKASLQRLERERKEKADVIEKDKRDRKRLLNKGSTERSEQLDRVSTVAEQIRSNVEQGRRQQRALLVLKDEIDDTRTNDAPYRLRQLQENHEEAGISDESWKAFLLKFSGNVDEILTAAEKAIDTRLRQLVGPEEQQKAEAEDVPASTTSLLPPDAKLETLQLNLLDKEIERLRKLIGIDAENAKTFARLSERISRDEAELAKFDRNIETAKKADTKIKELIESRKISYASVFDGILDEEKQLNSLYEPLRLRLESEPGALGKLTFSVHRVADVGAWANSGEQLLDLRKNGPFKGKGSLLLAADNELKSAWETGSSEDVSEAMGRFRESHERGITEHAPVERSDPQGYRNWAERVSAWLYGTEHIKVVYGIQYEGLDIEQLSPGTRGIVLLLLYLAIDIDDDRPLLIDQPEENLDPKSINDELVERFRKAKLRRQIIIVSHNANLVVNADADQVIVAHCGQHKPGKLPEITYQSGSLENPKIRRQVCDILEGGERAFKERARRLRIKI
jgi:ABC-type lipoprotein export system ATPase subunit